MRVVGLAVMTAMIGLVAAVPARAQMSGGGGGGSPRQPAFGFAEQDARRTGAEAERDRKYKDSLKKIPDAKASNDPWGSVRSDAPKTATTKAPAAAKAKTKTGSSQN